MVTKNLTQALHSSLSATNKGGLPDEDVSTLKNRGATDADIVDLEILLSSENVLLMPGIKMSHINIVNELESFEPTAEDLLAGYILKACEDEGVTDFNIVTIAKIFTIAENKGIQPDILRTKAVMLAIGKAILTKHPIVH